MEIVINISEEDYEGLKRKDKFNDMFLNHYEKLIVYGTPLPKGHGELVDRDAINDRFYNIWKELESYSNKPHWKDLLDKWSMCMDTAPAIIKADGGGEE